MKIDPSDVPEVDDVEAKVKQIMFIIMLVGAFSVLFFAASYMIVLRCVKKVGVYLVRPMVLRASSSFAIGAGINCGANLGEYSGPPPPYEMVEGEIIASAPVDQHV